MAKSNYSVALYKCDMAYGGPEEGGWYYNTGELIKVLKIFITEDKANMYAARAQCLIDLKINKGRREISSVLSEGRYFTEVYENLPPKYYPEQRPHYE